MSPVDPDPQVPEARLSESAKAVERRLLGAERELRRREVSGAVGTSLLSARKFWRALGFPNVGDAAQAFTEADVEALRQADYLVGSFQSNVYRLAAELNSAFHGGRTYSPHTQRIFPVESVEWYADP